MLPLPCAMRASTPCSCTGAAVVLTPGRVSGSRTEPSRNGFGSVATTSPSRTRAPVNSTTTRTKPGWLPTRISVAVSGAGPAWAAGTNASATTKTAATSGRIGPRIRMRRERV